MATRAFSIEDGNLATKSIITSQKRTYKDIDLSFAKKASGEIFKKTDAGAVKQAVKNVLLTSRLEKPFNPDFGAGLNRFLFDLDTNFDRFEVEDAIVSTLARVEPRARVIDVDAVNVPDQYTVNITVKFKVLSTDTIEQVTVSLTRLR
jgi:phage baseplate assembly protein W